MNEPQSSSGPAPTSVPDDGTAEPRPQDPNATAHPTPEPPEAEGSLEAEAEIPADHAQDVDTAEDTLAEHVARTDAALVAWRQDAERRREAFDAAQLRSREQMRVQRRRVVRFAAATGLLGLGLGFAAGVLFYRTWNLPSPAPVALEPPPSATARVPIAAAPMDPQAAPDLVPAPDPGVEVAAPAVREPRVDGLEVTGARVWTEGSHTWAAFASTEAGDLSLRYLDGAGNAGLDPMECQAPDPDGVRRCSAGRSAARIDAAVAAGAAPGTWTVEGCSGATCVTIGTFEVAPPGR